MALVGYSDSESSDNEDIALPQPQSTPAAKSAPHRILNGPQTGTKRIRLDLPALRSGVGSGTQETEDEAADRLTKRSRTGGTFSGFNSLLPPPKRTAQSAPRSSVSLKTSSEAVFSREPVESYASQNQDTDVLGGQTGNEDPSPKLQNQEPAIVGKATRFMPLSVANKKKKPKPKPKPPVVEDVSMAGSDGVQVSGESKAQEPPPQKPKRSLFTVTQDVDAAEEQQPPDVPYEPMNLDNDPITAPIPQHPPQSISLQRPPAPNSLEAVAADLNLTPAQRRQLFGRNAGRAAGAQVVTHFDTEAEYAANEVLRASGEVVEHRAVKTIAPGKHSLQQLVNNARSQREAMEDKWAEGKQARGDAGNTNSLPLYMEEIRLT